MTDMITLPRAEVLQVLEALLTCTWSKQTDAAIAALRERLAQPVRESYVHPISGRTADELWQETGRLRSELADLKARQQDEYKGWYCAHCQRGVDGSEVTYHEQHAVCGRVITYDVPPKAQQQQEPVASCQHKRYAVDVHEQTGRCFDCGAEGRMRFVVGNIAPVLASMFGVSQTTISRIKRGESY